MQAPFTTEEFLGVMTRYNEAVWPMQVLFYLIGALTIYAAVRRPKRANRWILLAFAFLWAWMAIVYHWVFFTRINPAAWAFGGLFLLQAVAFLVVALRGRLVLAFEPDGYGLTGAAFLAYALVIYPVLGAMAGHAYPAGPTFGLPCPTTIATFGLLLWSTRPVPLWLLVIPALWAIIGTGAALQFGIPEDYGLLMAGIVGTIMLVQKDRRSP